MNSGNTDKQDEDTSDEHAVASRANHDIRASMAIATGFNNALESSLSDLLQAVQLVLTEHDVDPQGESIQRIKGLEEDCLFCLLRINRSLEKLDAHLSADARFELKPTSYSVFEQP